MRIETIAVHGGYSPDPATKAVATPIYQTTSYAFDSTLACHPATTTHRQLSGEELGKAGVTEDMARLSIGIEHIDDILADIEQALQAAK